MWLIHRPASRQDGYEELAEGTRLGELKAELSKLQQERERDEEAFRSVLASHSSELTRAREAEEQQKNANHKLLADKATLQEELIEHLKALRYRDQTLGLLRRDLADSEFEVEQLRIAFRCATEYGMLLEAGREATESAVLRACAALEAFAAEAGSEAAAAEVAVAAAEVAAAGRDALCTIAARDVVAEKGGQAAADDELCAVKCREDGGQGKDSAGTWRPSRPCVRADCGSGDVGAHSGRPSSDSCRVSDGGSSQGRAAAEGHVEAPPAPPPPAAAGTGDAAAGVAAAASRAASVLTGLQGRLYGLARDLHALVVDPAAAAAAAALEGGLAAVGARRRGGSEAGGLHGGQRSPPPPPPTPPLPPAAQALMQLAAAAAAGSSKQRRTGGEAQADYDAGVGSLRDWGFRRHPETAAAAAAAATRRAGGSCRLAVHQGDGGRTGALSYRSVVGGLSPGTLSPCPSGTIPEQALGDSRLGEGGAGGTSFTSDALWHGSEAQGRSMGAGPSVRSPPPSPVLPALVLGVPHSLSDEGNSLAPCHVAPPAAAASDVGFSDRTAAAALAACAAAHSTGPDPIPASPVAGEPIDAQQAADPAHQPQHHHQRSQEAAHNELPICPSGGESGSAGSNAADPWASPTTPEVAALRRQAEALQRQVSELKRQNDLLQLRQLGSGGGNMSGTGSGACHGHGCGAHAMGAAAAPSWSHQSGLAAHAHAHAAEPFYGFDTFAAYHGSLPPGAGGSGRGETMQQSAAWRHAAATGAACGRIGVGWGSCGGSSGTGLWDGPRPPAHSRGAWTGLLPLAPGARQASPCVAAAALSGRGANQSGAGGGGGAAAADVLAGLLARPGAATHATPPAAAAAVATRAQMGSSGAHTDPARPEVSRGRDDGAAAERRPFGSRCSLEGEAPVAAAGEARGRCRTGPAEPQQPSPQEGSAAATAPVHAPDGRGEPAVGALAPPDAAGPSAAQQQQQQQPSTASAPPGVDPALWELDMLLAGSRSAAPSGW